MLLKLGKMQLLEFMNSSSFKELEGKDPNIDFLISNSALS